MRLALAGRLDLARQLPRLRRRLDAVFRLEPRLPLAVDAQCPAAVAVPIQQAHEAAHADLVIRRQLERAPGHHGRGLAIPTLLLDPGAFPRRGGGLLAQDSALVIEPLVELLRHASGNSPSSRSPR